MAKYVFVSEQVYPELKDTLIQRGFIVFEVPLLEHVDARVGSHADLFIMPFEDKIIIAKEISASLIPFLEAHQIPYEISNETLEPHYPYDVRLNGIWTGQYWIHKQSITDSKILQYIKEHDKKQINVAQGYTKCSTMILSPTAFVTADPGIAACLASKNMNVLSIEKGQIILEGFQHGFIGGCTGKAGDWIFINGDLSYHQDGNRIRKFIESNGLSIIEVPNKPLVDIGSILFYRS